MEIRNGGKKVWGKYFHMLCLFWIVFILFLSLQTVQYEDTISYKPWSLITLIAIYLISRIVFTRQLVDEKIILSAVIISSFYEICLGLWQLVSGHSNHYLYLVTGSFYNPGPYSAYVMVGVIASLSELNTENQKFFRMFCRVVVLSGFFVLLLTVSRSALIATCIISVWLYRKQIYPHRHLCLLATITIGIILFVLKYNSAMGRIVIWFVSWLVFTEHPLFGVDNYRAAYGEGLRLFFSEEKNIANYANYADITDFAYNDFLQVLVENGIIVFLGLCSFVVIAMYNLKTRSLSLYYSMISLIIFSLFSYPFQLFPYQLLFTLCCAWGNSGNGCFVVGIGRKWMIYPFYVIICYTGIIAASEVYRNRKLNSNYREFVSTKDPSDIKEYYRLLPMCDKNKIFLFDFAKLLRENKRFNDSNAVLRKGTLECHDPIFLVVMGNNYCDMGLYEEADNCYRKAFLTMPNRLYPLYKRMKLQESLSNRNETVSLCKKIIAFKPKVVSPATNQMKLEAEIIIDSISNNRK